MSRPIVTADIGGTHARFALAQVEAGRVTALGEPLKLRAADHGSLRTAWETFADHVGQPLPRAAAIGIAAPIRGNTIKMTNGSWTVCPPLIAEQLQLDDHILMNDFEAIAYAVAAVEPEEFLHICGPDIPLADAGPISVVGPGTGLGVGLVYRTHGDTHVMPTEGGHIAFAPLDKIEDRILYRLRQKYDRVSVERVVSGPGFRTIMEVLADVEKRPMLQGDDRTLWALALSNDNGLAAATLDRFGMCLGAAAGDIALSHGPGPVVIAGGLGLRIGKRLVTPGFSERFVAKGRYRTLMESLPVKLITHEEPGLYGAAAAFAKRFT